MILHNFKIDCILREKSSSVYFVNEADLVSSAISLMNRAKIGSVMVLHDHQYIGIFTERDVLTRVLAEKLDPDKTVVGDVMTRDYVSIDENHTLEETMRLMTQSRVRHLPVFHKTLLIGMVSIGDVTRKLLEINQNEAESLRQYLFSGYSG
jgi:CBS domain-containing protein